MRSVAHIDGIFRMKFQVETLFGVPGATYYNTHVTQKFVQNSSQQACDSAYEGQIIILILGE